MGKLHGVTIEEAQKYAGEDRGELNMVFQFEHVEDTCAAVKFGKWTDQNSMTFKDFKKIDDQMAGGTGREKHGTVFSWEIMTSQEAFPDLEMTIRHTERFLRKCWQPVFI